MLNTLTDKLAEPDVTTVTSEFVLSALNADVTWVLNDAYWDDEINALTWSVFNLANWATANEFTVAAGMAVNMAFGNWGKFSEATDAISLVEIPPFNEKNMIFKDYRFRS